MADLADRLGAEGVVVSRWSNGSGDRYAAHDHDYDKIVVVEHGSITFGAVGEAFDLRAGDRLELPAATRHDAVVGAGGVTCLEGHLPARTLPGTILRRAGTW